MFKKIVQKKLEKYVKQYFVKHPEVKLVVVVGSVGKTSTKVSIATVLSKRYKVRLHKGNHNTHLSAPLSILGIDYPGKVKSPLAWMSVFRAARQRVNEPSDVHVIVQELGVDRPGEMEAFSRYLLPDIAVVTAVTPEHMEFFKTMDAVAKEELSVAGFSKYVIINRDDIDGAYAQYLVNSSMTTYGTGGAAEYRFESDAYSLGSGHSGRIITPEFYDGFPVNIKVLGEHSLRPAVGAATVGLSLGLTTAEVAAGLADIRPVHGRMNPLRGVKGSTLIDDTYNSSPTAATSALQTLYTIEAPQRIAVLGSMNELGESSSLEHEALGKVCDPNLLAWVVTIGEEAEKYLAPAARAKGCQVKSFSSAIDAGAFVHKVLEPGAIVLFKGSQGSIYTEEALKVVLHSTEEESQLVRQSASWLERKNRFFSKFS